MKNKFLLVLAATVIILTLRLIMTMPDRTDKINNEENEVIPTQAPLTDNPSPSDNQNPDGDLSKFDFEKTGNLVGDELVYEEPGKPALRVKLTAGEDSWCDGRKCGSSLKGKYAEGQRVSVKGVMTGEKEVSVKYLTTEENTQG